MCEGVTSYSLRMRAAKGRTMADLWMFNYRGWLNAGFDSWDALAYCFHGTPTADVWGDDFPL